MNTSSFDKTIDSYLTFSVDTIGVDDLIHQKEKLILIDIRSKDEFNVSHINGAIHQDDFVISNYEKDQEFVVYCSIGARSEEYGQKLKSNGYLVKNLYGGIFKWKNQDNPVVNNLNEETEEVHTYSKTWSKWLTKGKKVY